MIMSPRYLIAAAVVIAAFGTSTSARADARNEVRAVSFAEDGGMTRVHVRGATTPTFTVYKLERPSRVVIDLPQARLAEGLRGHESAATYTANTWAVSTIAAQQLDDGAVRVIVTLARPGRYDVKTDGNEVVVMVTPRDAAPKTANPADLARAQAESEQAKKQAQAAEQARVAANTEAERLRKLAADQAAKAAAAQRAVDEAKQQLAKNTATAQDLARAQQAAKAAQDEATRAQKIAQTAQVEAERMKLAAEQARRDALADAQKARSEAAQQQLAATKAREEATQQQLAATKAREETARSHAEAKKIKDDVAKAQADAQALVAKSRAEADAAKLEAQTAKADAARARSEAETAKKQAETSKRDAEKMLKDAKYQLATLEQKTLASQQLEDKARATLAAAQAREEAARASVAKAMKEREAAEAAAKQARDASDKSVAADRARLAAEAKAAEERLAKARQSASDADIRRVTAEQAATRARMDLEHTKTALASVEQQRASAVAAATDAARKRSEAEAAASDAARRRNEAEVAANDAARKRKDAETAKDAAERQRQIAEAAAQQAMGAKRDAEASLASLNTKRLAAERAANEVAERAKAEGKAQAEMAAAKARKASDDEVAAAKREVARLAEERKRAETELADKRKAVAAQQAESTRLATLAAQAKDSAEREESRRTQLVAQRTKEEQELARIKAQKQAQAVQAQVAHDQTRTTQVRIAPTRTTQPPAPVAVKGPAPAAAKAPAPAKRANVQDIKFKASADTGLVEIAMAGDANVQLGNISASHVELIVDNADIPAKLERTLDVSKLGSPVKKVSSFRDRRTPNRVRLVAELASPAIPTVVRDGNTVRWRFAANHAVAQKPAQSIPPTVVGGFGAASTPVSQQAVSQVPPAPGRGRRVYHGATVEFHFKDAPIHDLLRIIADTGGVNIVVPDTIDAKVTVDMKRVPWDQALEVILASHGLWYRREGNLYRIAPRKELDAEDEAEAARRAAAAASEMPRPEIVTLNYASADELKMKLEGMLSPKGKIEVDGRTNSLIISDIGANRQEIARLALQLDTQTPQITIEARIVEARSTFVRQFGIQWGGRALMGAAGGNATGLVFPSSIGIRGGNDDNQTRTGGISALPSDFAINLPAATGTGEGGAIGLSLGSVGGNFNINLRLSALEDTGTVRIISAPKITVLNNKAALIRQGVSIPISVVSAAGTQTQFVQADLKLEVTPYVSQRDCAIAMQLDVTKNEPDFVNTGARGDPTILRKEAKTTMLVADGETSVLGGIYTRNTGLAYKKVPFFADLPVIGWFFKSRRENDDRTEILVFITPKITNKASLRCAQ
jgi:type IV pilus assembly protein PilQ